MYVSSWNNIDIILKLLNISGKTHVFWDALYLCQGNGRHLTIMATIF